MARVPDGGTGTTLPSQTTLLDVQPVPRLTARQAHALTVLQDAGPTGLQPVVLGATLHDWSGTHPASRSCDFCHSAGIEVLRALRRKGVARLRRVDGHTFWQAAVLPESGASFGEFPEGY